MTKQAKTKYRIRNWADYNRALTNRGSLTIWFENSPEKWLAIKQAGKKGRPRTYSDEAILYALVIRAVFHMPLRALRGFLLWPFSMIQVDLPEPCYTRICRRAANLGQELKSLTKGCPTDIVFDSTGVKVYGEGEWKVCHHGKGEKRTWRKVHLGVCPGSHEIVLSELTESKQTDGRVGKKMAKKIPKSVKTVFGDGAYDQGPFYQELYEHGIQAIIPPRRDGRLQNLDRKLWVKGRNDAIRAITGLGKDDEARKLWKILSRYHKRSI